MFSKMTEAQQDNFKATIKDLVHLGVVTVKFKKLNGEIREMNCTLRADLLPPVPEVDPLAPPKKVRTPSPDALAVFDLDKQDWRAFRYDSIVSFTIG